MQVFELHFNPKLREEQIFDSFVFEPENIYERKLGSLYMAGELKNTLPQNSNFLDNFAKIIKKNYYSLSLQSPEKALSQSLKKINDFLAQELKENNVSWLGNLNFAILSLKDLNLIFTKTGDLKILLIRDAKINDIGKSLELREIEPYPLKIFLNVVTGKLAQNDIVLVLTKEVFDFFWQQDILTKIALAEKIDSKTIKEILPSPLFTKGEGSKISGICFLVVIKAIVPRLEVEKPRRIRFQKEKRGLNLFLPLIQPFAVFKKFIYFKKYWRKITKIKKIPYRSVIKKKIILVLVLILILLLGFLIFRE